jgi:septum formation inhibitor-activating ATPase MinD
MSIKKKYPKAEPKKHGSNNIYIDAALEAMAQAREENEGLSYMIVVHAPETCGVQMAGDVCGVAATLAHFAKKEKKLHELVTLLKYGTEVVEDKETSALDNFLKELKKGEKLIDGYLDELMKNRPEDSK